MHPSSSAVTSSVTRRRVLGWGGVGAIGAITGYLSWPRPQIELGKATHLPDTTSTEKPVEAAPSEVPSPTGVIGREDFLPHLKSAFALDSGMNCTLVEVSAARKVVAPTAEFTSFSLLFDAPVDFPADSRIHRLTHREMGEMDLFLSPVGRSKESVQLEAIFSQRV